jgi:hypothetical protein
LNATEWLRPLARSRNWCRRHKPFLKKGNQVWQNLGVDEVDAPCEHVQERT